ncbi:DUF6431 domain-containing protein [Scatolibacter rhodanostii]|uniref:DUF6431 domain-containing protein n=1 Tax=Scatolibacter rhodanostii TaxID=2014781 RepID=UPI000C08AC91|nr:DUF6431 domain-containing protein [Scatolibacter rhodanostii]
MVVIKSYDRIECADGFIRVKTNEKCCCSVCGGILYVRDSKPRKVINQAGITKIYRLRRLKCQNCGYLHTEIPGSIVPYKHYAAEVIEAEIWQEREDCPADNNTSWRWKSFFASILILAQKHNFFSSQSHWISKAYQIVEKFKLLTHPVCVPFESIRCYNSK